MRQFLTLSNMHLKTLFQEQAALTYQFIFLLIIVRNILLEALDKFYEMTFYFVNFLFASQFPSCILFVTV